MNTATKYKDLKIEKTREELKFELENSQLVVELNYSDNSGHLVFLINSDLLENKDERLVCDSLEDIQLTIANVMINEDFNKIKLDFLKKNISIEFNRNSKKIEIAMKNQSQSEVDMVIQFIEDFLSNTENAFAGLLS
jgi:hypothetical protein